MLKGLAFQGGANFSNPHEFRYPPTSYRHLIKVKESRRISRAHR